MLYIPETDISLIRNLYRQYMEDAWTAVQDAQETYDTAKAVGYPEEVTGRRAGHLNLTIRDLTYAVQRGIIIFGFTHEDVSRTLDGVWPHLLNEWFPDPGIGHAIQTIREQ